MKYTLLFFLVLIMFGCSKSDESIPVIDSTFCWDCVISKLVEVNIPNVQDGKSSENKSFCKKSEKEMRDIMTAIKGIETSDSQGVKITATTTMKCYSNGKNPIELN